MVRLKASCSGETATLHLFLIFARLDKGWHEIATHGEIYKLLLEFIPLAKDDFFFNLLVAWQFADDNSTVNEISHCLLLLIWNNKIQISLANSSSSTPLSLAPSKEQAASP
jgi:hypothetical protein